MNFDSQKNRRFSDIYIPSQEEKTEATLKENIGRRGIKISLGINLKKIIFLAVLLGIASVSFAYAFNVKLNIQLTPIKEDFLIEEKATIEKSAQASDIENLKLSSKPIEVETIKSELYQSAGNKISETKATGIIRVYNNYSETPQALVATTRFLSSDGKLFRTTKKVSIPGAEYKNGKLTSNYAEVTVEAAEAGEEYNIEPATFSIPGFAGTAKYTGFYGKSLNKMTGGSRKTIKFVSKNDISKAKNSLEKLVFEEGLKDLQKQVPDGYEIIQGSLEQEIIKDQSNVNEGLEADNFSLKFKAKSKALIISKEELNNLGKKLAFKRLSQDKEINPSSLAVNYGISDFDSGKEKIEINLEIKGESFTKINTDALFEEIKTQRLSSLEQILNEKNNFAGIKFEKTPFWLSRVPLDKGKVKIEVNLD
ncbi:MAG: hypothetical protein Q8O39_01285 [bacterium]|nr:hypothetical protein [bacterium]